MREREIHKQILLSLNAELHPRGQFWTCDTGQIVPISEAKRAVKEILRLDLKQGAAALRAAAAEIVRSLRRMMVGVIGQPDIQGCLDGRWIGIEVKTEKGRQREGQKVFQAAIERAGGVYIIARSPEEAIEGVIAAVGLPSVAK